SAAIPLGHKTGLGLFSNAAPPDNASAPKPMVAGIAVNRSGTVGIAANFYNDSISVLDLKARRVAEELDLRPGVNDASKTGVAGGEYPYWVAIMGDDRAYVSSPRDREIAVIRLHPEPSIVSRISISGQPNRVLLNRDQDLLFAAVDSADAVVVV